MGFLKIGSFLALLKFGALLKSLHEYSFRKRLRDSSKEGVSTLAAGVNENVTFNEGGRINKSVLDISQQTNDKES